VALEVATVCVCPRGGVCALGFATLPNEHPQIVYLPLGMNEL